MHTKAGCMQAPNHVLHVDDDVSYTRLVARRMKTLGYSVISLNDPRGIETHVTSLQIGIILLDLDMPWRHGLEVLESLRKMPGDRRVIVLSGCISVGTVINAMALGADYLFFKDRFDFSELADAIASLQSRRRQWFRGAQQTARHQRLNRLERDRRAAEPGENNLSESSTGEQAMWDAVASHDDAKSAAPKGSRSPESRQIQELIRKRMLTKAALGRAERIADQLTPTLLQLALSRGMLTPEDAIRIASAGKKTEAAIARELLSQKLCTATEIRQLEHQQSLLRPPLITILSTLGEIPKTENTANNTSVLAI